MTYRPRHCSACRTWSVTDATDHLVSFSVVGPVGTLSVAGGESVESENVVERSTK